MKNGDSSGSIVRYCTYFKSELQNGFEPRDKDVKDLAELKFSGKPEDCLMVLGAEYRCDPSKDIVPATPNNNERLRMATSYLGLGVLYINKTNGELIAFYGGSPISVGMPINK